MKSEFEIEMNKAALKSCQQIEPAISRNMVSRGHSSVAANEGFKAGADWAYQYRQVEIDKLKSAIEVMREAVKGSCKFDEDSGIDKIEECDPEFQRYQSFRKSIVKADEILKGDKTNENV